MLQKRVLEQGKWTLVDYQTTWKYGYDFMLDALQVILDNDITKPESFSVNETLKGAAKECLADLKNHTDDVRKCESLQEDQEVMVLGGFSEEMGTPVQFIFYKGTDAVRVCFPVKEYIEKNGVHIFDHYMNELEIRAYCKDAVRRSKAA